MQMSKWIFQLQVISVYMFAHFSENLKSNTQTNTKEKFMLLLYLGQSQCLTHRVGFKYSNLLKSVCSYKFPLLTVDEILLFPGMLQWCDCQGFLWWAGEEMEQLVQYSWPLSDNGGNTNYKNCGIKCLLLIAIDKRVKNMHSQND